MQMRNRSSVFYIVMDMGFHKTTVKLCYGAARLPCKETHLHNSLSVWITTKGRGYRKTLLKPRYGIAKLRCRGFQVLKISLACSMKKEKVFHKTSAKHIFGRPLRLLLWIVLSMAARIYVSVRRTAIVSPVI